MKQHVSDVLVIGGGAAGAMAALAAAAEGATVTLLARGYGATAQSPGVVDICGRDAAGHVVTDPLVGVQSHIEQKENHPYALPGNNGSTQKKLEVISQALDLFRQMVEGQGLPYAGELNRNRHLPTVLGTIKTTSLVPLTSNIDLSDLSGARLLVVGLQGYQDLHPVHVAHSLAALAPKLIGVELNAESVWLELPGLRGGATITSTEIALALERPEAWAAFVIELGRMLHGRAVDAVLLPPVLGYKRAAENVEELRRRLNLPVAEILPNPHSVPGQRLQRALVDSLKQKGVQFNLGLAALRAEVEAGACRQIIARNRRGEVAYPARAFVLAGGDLVGGGLVAGQGTIIEPLLNLPVANLADEELTRPQLLDPAGHPLFAAGLTTDRLLRPLNPAGRVVAANLFVAGALLGGADRDREGNGMGIALSTGYVAGRRATVEIG